MVTVVAWEKLFHVEAIAVFDDVTSVVVKFAFIDIWREGSRVDYSKSTDLRAELRPSLIKRILQHQL